MVKSLVVAFALLAPGLALACDGQGECPHCARHADADKAASDPASCAKKAELVGGACSYTTGMMAQRVLSEGNSWSYTGSLVSAGKALESHVAAPYKVGPDGVYVVANEVLDQLTDAGAQSGRVDLQGKLLEVDGVKYFVLTSFASANS